jgi:signal peptidase I
MQAGGRFSSYSEGISRKEASLRALIKEWVGLAAYVGGFYLLFNTLLFAGFHVSSESMLPTLKVGDQFYVLKFSYGYSRFSTSFMPLPESLGSGRLFGRMPERGDIALFPVPGIEQDYVKRIMGLPGDRLQMKAGRLWINGVQLEREQTRAYRYRDDYGRLIDVTEYKETLPDGRQHLIMEVGDDFPADDTPEFVVPEGHVFAMGDNRDNSEDSRFMNKVGYVPMERLMGKVTRVAFARKGCADEEGLVCPSGGWADRLWRKLD